MGTLSFSNRPALATRLSVALTAKLACYARLRKSTSTLVSMERTEACWAVRSFLLSCQTTRRPLFKKFCVCMGGYGCDFWERGWRGAFGYQASTRWRNGIFHRACTSWSRTLDFGEWKNPCQIASSLFLCCWHDKKKIPQVTPIVYVR